MDGLSSPVVAGMQFPVKQITGNAVARKTSSFDYLRMTNGERTNRRAGMLRVG